ncbi:MAG: glycoside hydrolase family 127 protein [Sedimentisphaerales bacterium]|nr:glycoside hydrolase family 127 protein [Sedimentisphaerales bacterium]
MKTRHFFLFCFLLSAVFAAAIFNIAFAQNAAEKTGVNLALAAKSSGSYVSGDTTLDALNDGFTPRNSRDSSQGSYGNWNRTGTQWVQYEWDKPVSTSKIDVYWWDDGRGVRLPGACRLLYWNGNAFVSVSNPQGLGTAGNQFNTTTFDEISTTKLKLEIDSAGTDSTGILEWRVYDSGKSPDFPPQVNAGIDRVCVVGSKTYLNGKVKILKQTNDSSHVLWSKESGPGNVTFENSSSLITTAAFSSVGEYVLKLTAGQEPLIASSTVKVKVESMPPSKSLEHIEISNYKINSPLWNDRAKNLIVNWIPHCIAKISDPNLREGGINNFIDAANKLAGNSAGRHRGYVFSNAWVYNTLESICIAIMIDSQGDAEIIKAQNAMKATIEDWIPKILAAQEPDGYLQTAFTLSNRQRWSPRTREDHEGYVAGYLLEAAVAHHIMTGGKDLRLYNAAKKLADCWNDNIGPAPKKPWYDGHQVMEMALVRFGRYVNKIEGQGKGDKYIELSKFLLDCRGGGSEYDQSHLPVVQQYEAVGHAVRASYSYAGMADIAVEKHDIDYISAVNSLWDNIVNKKYYITGGIGSGETSEGFGPNYSLRNNAYCESCSSCGEIFFQHKMNRLYHDAKYADLYEETLYNALLGSVSLDCKVFYYQNPLDSSAPRTEWHNCPCCVGNIPRTLLNLPSLMYMKDSDSIYVNLFIGSTVKIENIAGTNVEMVQITDYPWSGNVSVTVNPQAEKNFSIKVRVPNRQVSSLYKTEPQADGITSISVNGAKITPAIENGYAVITRSWKSGDKIELELPMKVQLVKADERIEANRGKAALRYGPLIYSIERVDQDLNKILNTKAALTTEWRPDLLNGVMTIKGAFTDGSQMIAIPNYTRDNRNRQTGAARGRGGLNSIVWIRDQ